MAALAAHQALGNVFEQRLRECANCLVFNYQCEEVTLQQCSRCKVITYCDKQCQKEHWHLVHKQHCKKLAEAKAEEERNTPGLQTSTVSVYSHHPFSKGGMSGDIHEGLILSVGQIITKMRSTRHPACSSFKNEIDSLEQSLIAAQRRIWYIRKVYPRNYIGIPHSELIVPFINFTNNARCFYVNASKRSPFAKLDLWSSLLLFMEQILEKLVLGWGIQYKKGKEKKSLDTK